ATARRLSTGFAALRRLRCGRARPAAASLRAQPSNSHRRRQRENRDEYAFAHGRLPVQFARQKAPTRRTRRKKLRRTRNFIGCFRGPPFVSVTSVLAHLVSGHSTTPASRLTA